MRAMEELSCPNEIPLSPFNTSPMRFTEERRWKRCLQAGIASPQTIFLTSHVVHGRRQPPPRPRTVSRHSARTCSASSAQRAQIWQLTHRHHPAGSPCGQRTRAVHTHLLPAKACALNGAVVRVVHRTSYFVHRQAPSATVVNRKWIS